MLLHDIPDADIQNEDSLTNPQHLDGGELMRFDRVISNAPFSQNCSRQDPRLPERFCYGFGPVGNMTVASLPGRNRSGAEKEIGRGPIVDDLLAAVLGLPPYLSRDRNDCSRLRLQEQAARWSTHRALHLRHLHPSAALR
jgi:type I restriction enzyme M protein